MYTAKERRERQERQFRACWTCRWYDGLVHRCNGGSRVVGIGGCPSWAEEEKEAEHEAD